MFVWIIQGIRRLMSIFFFPHIFYIILDFCIIFYIWELLKYFPCVCTVRWLTERSRDRSTIPLFSRLIRNLTTIPASTLVFDIRDERTMIEHVHLRRLETPAEDSTTRDIHLPCDYVLLKCSFTPGEHTPGVLERDRWVVIAESYKNTGVWNNDGTERKK